MEMPPSSSPMTARTVVMVVLRLFALYWAITAVPTFFFQTAWNVRQGLDMLFLSGLTLVILLGLTVGCWFVAPAIARWITRRDDLVVQISGLTLEDLFAFGFIFVGLWFVLGAIGRCVWYLYFYWLFVAAPPAQQQYLTAPDSDWIIYLVQLLVAGIVLFNARKWAGKLLRWQKSE